MDILILYYSMSGNTEEVARAIHSAVDGKLMKFEPKGGKRVSVAKGAVQALFKAKPPMEPLAIDPAEYDLIFLGCPVWAGHAAPVIHSFAGMYPLAGKKVALFCTCADKPGVTLEQMKEKFPNAEIIDTMCVKTPMKDTAEVVKWANEVLERSR